jgi:hypothetical protein
MSLAVEYSISSFVQVAIWIIALPADPVGFTVPYQSAFSEQLSLR